MRKRRQAARAARAAGRPKSIRSTAIGSVCRGTALVAIFALGAGGLVALTEQTTTAANPVGEDEKTVDRLEETRSALEKWHDARRRIAKAKRDWALGKEILTQQVDVVKRETEKMLARVDEAKKNITAATEKLAEHEKSENDLVEAGKAFADKIDVLEARVVQLLKRVPTLAQERVKPLSRRIPEDPTKTKETLSNRFATIIGILGDLNKFNREIHTTSEVRKLENGEEVEVTTLYEGISQGYYVTNDDKMAGMGRPTADGWAWEPIEGAGPAIREAILVATGEKAATFVPLPLKIQRIQTNTPAPKSAPSATDATEKGAAK